METISRVTVWQKRSSHASTAADAYESRLTVGRIYYEVSGAGINRIPSLHRQTTGVYGRFGITHFDGMTTREASDLIDAELAKETPDGPATP